MNCIYFHLKAIEARVNEKLFAKRVHNIEHQRFIKFNMFTKRSLMLKHPVLILKHPIYSHVLFVNIDTGHNKNVATDILRFISASLKGI